MANKFSDRSDFSIPSSIYDEHEWVVDYSIDGPTGQVCTLIYPDKITECDNCIFDTNANRSSGIYKTGGPISFANYAICPRCGGVGRFALPFTENIRLRIYWDKSSWIDIGVKLLTPTSSAMIIGYMSDLPKIEKCNRILINTDIVGMRRYICMRDGEAQPWGFQHKRYFLQYIRRLEGG